MRAIRCVRNGGLGYYEIFKELTGKFAPGLAGRHFSHKSPRDDATNRLTDLREALAAKGYAKEVEEADSRFLEYRLCYHLNPEGRPPLTQEEWDKRWEEYIKKWPVKPYPEDAL